MIVLSAANDEAIRPRFSAFLEIPALPLLANLHRISEHHLQLSRHSLGEELGS
jgi:hypothetical protein